MEKKTTTSEPSINDLKSAVYDRMVEIEQHSLRIQQLQKECQQINVQIQAKAAKEKE